MAKKPTPKRATKPASSIKAQRNPRAFIASSMRTIEGAGTFGAKPRPRNQDSMVKRLMGWMYACANLNAKGFAGTKLCLYTKRANGEKLLRRSKAIDRSTKRYLMGDAKRTPSAMVLAKANSLESNEDIEQISDHPILDLFKTVNGNMNGYQFSWLRAMFMQMTGNVYLHPVMNQLRVPGELWMMPSQWVEIIPDKSHQQLVSGYVYGQRPNERVFQPDEVLHDKQPALDDMFYGKGPAYYACITVDLLGSMDEYEMALFDNHARPDWAIFSKENMTETQYTRLMSSVQGMLKGKKKQGNPYIFEGGLDAKPLQFNPKDLAHAEGEKRKVEQLCAEFGISYTQLTTADATYANGEMGDYAWKKNTIHPMCVSDEQFLNQSLLPMFEGSEDYFLAYEDCVPADVAQASTIAVGDVNAGIKTINERRAEQGLEPVEGGDIPRVNGVPIDMMGMSMGFGVPGLPSGQTIPGDVPTEPDGSAPNTATPPMPADPNAPVAPAQEGQAAAVKSNDLRQTVGGSTAILALQTAYYAGEVPRVAAIANATMVFGFKSEEAEALFPDEPPDAPKSESQLADEEAARAAFNGGSSGNDNPDDDEPAGPGGGGNKHPAPKPPGGGNAKSAGLQDKADGGMGGLQRAGDDHVCVDHGHDSASEVAELHKAWDTGEGINTKAIDDPQSGIADAALIAFAASMSETLRKQFNAMVAQLEVQGITANQAVVEALKVLILPEYAKAVADAARPFMESAINAGGQFGIRRLRGITASLPPALGFDVTNPEVQKFIDRYTVKLSNGVNNYTYVRARDILNDGLNKGESISQLTERVQEWAGKVGDGVRGLEYRAANIARTESARAYVAGQEEAWKQTGVVSGKRWLLGPSPCSFCSAMAQQFNGKTVNLGTAFLPQGATITDGEGATMTLDYSETMGPPLHPQCVCDVIPVLDDET